MRKIMILAASTALLTACITIPKEDVERARREGIPFLVGAVYPRTPNTAGGVDVGVHAVNTSDEPLKYALILVEAYNRVGDAARSEIDGKNTARLRITGPIRPASRLTGYKWSNVWYNHTISCVEITEVRVTAMDGTVQRYSGDELVLVTAATGRRDCQP